MQGFRVIKAGIFDTIQDLGRYGFQRFGMPTSGAMDTYALRIGNILLENPQNEAGIEISSPGLTLEILTNTIISITGANLSPTINGNPIPMWEVISVKKGDIISFTKRKNGVYAYLLIAGGIDIPLVLGSKSTYTRGKIGGIDGRPLKSKDIININPPTGKDIIGRKVSDQFIPTYKDEEEIRVMMGPQDDYFTDNGISTFLNSIYEVTPNSDRMGYRLKGEKIEPKKGVDITTDGIPQGSIQIPGDGMPIVMLRDCQTTGGYAKIATSISIDIDKLTQIRPGGEIKFEKISLDKAHNLLHEREKLINNLTFKRINTINNKRTFKVRIKNKIYNVEIEEVK